ncbi:MAG: DUF1318 domain-containing protein [Nitrospirae bacterium]|nr:DUF1318 domain-containing protein [Nitrospirota bacterium]
MKTRTKYLLVALIFIITSCVAITVNIYFPEKDVQEAYKNLEKELMKTDQEENIGKPEEKPQSSIRFEFIATANAQESGLADKVSEIVKKMPDVVNAYNEMGKRLPEIDRLRDSGVVGEGNNGLLIEREGKLSPQDKKLVNMENENRKTVMNGMAKAIIRVNRDRENEETMKKAMPLAVEQFAALRRDKAKKGWWIQDANGNWDKK